jgi:hypothetical protein
MRPVRAFALLLGAAIIVAISAALVQASNNDSGQVALESPQELSDQAKENAGSVTIAPPPESSAPSWVSERTSNDIIGIELDPPSQEPSVSGHDAELLAWSEGIPDGAKSMSAVYGVATWGSLDAYPVWVVRFDGTCVPTHGGVGSEADCRAVPFNVVIDANNGDFVASFASSDS